MKRLAHWLTASLAHWLASRLLLIAYCLLALPAFAGVAVDATAVTHQTSNSSTVTSATFSTTSANELFLAFISCNCDASTTVSSVSGASLTWVQVLNAHTEASPVFIWRAFSAGTQASVSVTATLSASQSGSYINVVTFSGVDTTGTNGAGAIGATTTGGAATGAPSASVNTTRNNSWVWGAGGDFTTNVTPTAGSNQTLEDTDNDSSNIWTAWTQKQNAVTSTSGTNVTINDTAPTADNWNLGVVEILPPSVGGGAATMPPRVAVNAPTRLALIHHGL